MRNFITLPLLAPGTPKSWTQDKQEYIIRDLYLEANQVESFHEEAHGRYTEVEMKSGKTHKIDMSLSQLLEALGVTDAPNTTKK